MIVDAHRYIADIVSPDGVAVGSLPVSPDWRPALEWCHWEGVRRGKLPPLARCPGGKVEPIWDADRGEPYVGGVRITLSENHQADGAPLVFEIPRRYLTRFVEQCAARLVTEGKLRAGDRFAFEASAFQHAVPTASSRAAVPDDFVIEEVHHLLHLDSASLESFATSARHEVRREEGVGDMPVFIPRRVVEEATDLARDAGKCETGGILVGRLYRDTASSEVFSAVTAQIPAQHTKANTALLTFTHETWAAARAAIELRGEGELMVAWWHSHPHWCADCDLERRRVCPLSRPFFSRDDMALHATVFGQGFQVALLLSDLGNERPVYDVFGWRHGMVEHRGYHLTGAGPDTAMTKSGTSGASIDVRPARIDDHYRQRNDDPCAPRGAVGALPSGTDLH